MSDDLLSIFDQLDAHDAPQTREDVVRACFSYPGGKSRSIRQIIDALPVSKVFVDACCGAGNILLCKHPSSLDVMNDRHAGVHAFFTCLRDPQLKCRLEEMLTLCPHSRETFLEFKAEWKNKDDPVERAYRWYYCVIFSFQSLGRNFGRSVRDFNQLASKLKKNFEYFDYIHTRLWKNNVLIENLDIMHAISDFDSYDTVTYIDPPYPFPESAALYEHKVDHVKLLNRIFELKAFVAISSYKNDLYESYKWDQIKRWKVLGSAAAQADAPLITGREDIEECLYIKEYH